MSYLSVIIIYIIVCNYKNTISRDITRLKSIKKGLNKIRTTIFIIKIFKF